MGLFFRKNDKKVLGTPSGIENLSQKFDKVETFLLPL